MAETTGIEWADKTWNPFIGCIKKTPECDNCYIKQAIRGKIADVFSGPVLTSQSTWDAPLKWNREAAANGTRPRVFTCSLSDFFEKAADPWRPAAWDVIRKCPNLDWLILTKNAARFADHLPPDWGEGWPHVWLGVTVGIATSMSRIPYLLDVPAKVRFISAEPLLGPLDFTPYLADLDWIITGCESGAKDKRRAMDFQWVRDVDKQCRKAGVAHFFKQYYDEKDKLCYDGMLDGECRQAWPAVDR